MSISVVKCSVVKCGEVWLSVAKCCEVLQCNDGTNNKVSDIIIRLLDNRKLLLICILLLLHSLIFFGGFLFL